MWFVQLWVCKSLYLTIKMYKMKNCCLKITLLWVYNEYWWVHCLLLSGIACKSWGQKTRFRSPLYFKAVLNLNCSLVFFFNSFFLYFFEKVPKTGQSCTAFGASFVQELLCNIFQSVHTSPLAACRNAWGGKNSLRSNIMPPVSKHCSAARCASQRCPSALGGELPFAMN